ncbi:MAG TPA: hypothetical protein VEQ67_15215 [Mycobacterium sp.]|nr:hypothetical protein [Mycobacterium sp.]
MADDGSDGEDWLYAQRVNELVDVIGLSAKSFYFNGSEAVFSCPVQAPGFYGLGGGPSTVAGPIGPQGPTGATGLPGPAGPPGAGAITLVDSPGATITVGSGAGPTVHVDLPTIGGVAGTYTNLNATIDAEGRVIVAASGAAGAAQPFNVTPDTHGTIPIGIGLGPNDEFEGAALDTAGTRYAGATAWTTINLGSSVITQSNGSIQMTGDATANSLHSIVQPVAGSAWRFRAKINEKFITPGNSFGFICRESGSTKSITPGLLINSGEVPQTWIAYWTNDATFNNFVGLAGAATIYDTYFHQWLYPLYAEVELAAGTITFRLSAMGDDNTFLPITSITLATAGMAAVDQIGLGWFTGGGVATPCNGICDWFRQEA